MSRPDIKQNNIIGIFLMLLNVFALSIQYTTVKILTSQGISSNIIVLLFKLMILVSVTPWILKDGFSGFKTTRFPLHILRAFFSMGGSLAFLYGISHMDMVDAMSIKYLEQVLVLILGIVLFKESISKSKLVAIFVSFFGAIVVVYPELISFDGLLPSINTQALGNANKYYVFILIAIFLWASNNAAIKILGKTEKSKVQVFYVMLFSFMWGFPVAGCNWEVIELGIKVPTSVIAWEQHGLNWSHFPYLLLMAGCYFIHSITHFKALQYAEMSVAAPVEYTKMVFLGIMGYFILGETVDHSSSYIGYALIITAGLVLVRSEAKKRRKMRKKAI